MSGAADAEAGRERVSDMWSVAGTASMPRPLGCPREGTIAAWALPASARRQHPARSCPAPAGAGRALWGLLSADAPWLEDSAMDQQLVIQPDRSGSVASLFGDPKGRVL